MTECSDCGCPLHCHDSGFCYNEGCCRAGECRHEPMKFDATTPSGRWTVADATGDTGADITLGEIYPSEYRVEELPKRALRIVVAYGTRPEKIKLAPVTSALRDAGVEVVEWCSGQQRDLAPGEGTRYAWNNLAHGISMVLEEFEQFLAVGDDFDAVVVQGDTATAFACAQAAFLARVPVAHVEAGLRTYAEEPWPEEAFRRQIGAVARWHFAPDEDAMWNIAQEIGIAPSGTFKCKPEECGIFVVGNTVIDTLPQHPFKVLVTLHRRENWGKRIADALWQFAAIAAEHDAHVIVIKHPNWSQHQNETTLLAHSTWINFVEPMSREELLAELRSSDVVVTDSGGLQEEAAHFGIDTIVLRTATERVALARTGAVELVDPDSPTSLRDALEAKLARRRCYGVGDSGKRIATILVRELTSLASKSSTD